MSKVAELRESIKKTVAEIRTQADAYNIRRKTAGQDHWPDDSFKIWEETNKRYDDLGKELKTEEDAANVEARMNKINEDEKQSTRHGRQMPGLDDLLPGEERTYGEAGFGSKEEARSHAQGQVDRRQALRAWLIRSAAPHLITDEMRDSCNRIKFYPEHEQLRFNLLDTENYAILQERAAQCHPTTRMQEKRALSKVTATAGAELVPTTFVAMIEMAMLAYGPFLAYVDTITTETGEPQGWPTGDDTANEGASLAEGVDAGDADPTTALFQLSAYEYISKFIKVPITLTRDSLVNLDLLIADLIGQRFGRVFTKHATIANTAGQIRGITLDAHLGKTTAGSAAITTDEMIDLQQSLDMAYRGKAAWMAHDNIIGIIRKLKDTTGRYLWESNIAVGRPDSIYGQPVIPNQYMASALATTNLSVLYGDFSYYKFRRVGTSANIMRLTERFAEKLQIGYLGHISADGKLLRPNATTSCPVKKLVQV